MSKPSRRQFIKTSAAASTAFATFTIAGTKSSAKVLGANDRVRIGVAGINGRGGSHLGSWLKMDDVEVAWLIDPDQKVLDRRSSSVKDKQGKDPSATQDVREALDDKELNAISIATPNHWHSLMSIWACQAGKDVYVEKPLSHNVHEGRMLVEAAKKHGRIVQHGTQSRSSGGHAKRAREIAEGKHGKLEISRGYCYKRRGSIGVKETNESPDHLDFNIWLGPAKDQAYHGNLVHYNWHWFWDFGNGDIGNQGVHQMDIARWMIPGATLPKSVIAVGGRFGYEDQGETPNTQLAIFDYGDSLLVFEVRGLQQFDKDGKKRGNKIGNDQVFNKDASAKPKEVSSHENVKSPTGDRGPGNIFSNFIHCVKTRKQEELDAHVLEGHYSSALCHLANMSYRLGENAPYDKSKQAIGDNKEIVEQFLAMNENLKENGVELQETEYRVGRKLTIDPETESIVGDKEANELLTRPYRAPFQVPEKIASL